MIRLRGSLLIINFKRLIHLMIITLLPGNLRCITKEANGHMV